MLLSKDLIECGLCIEQNGLDLLWAILHKYLEKISVTYQRVHFSDKALLHQDSDIKDRVIVCTFQKMGLVSS
jgi:hypothetical protein